MKSLTVHGTAAILLDIDVGFQRVLPSMTISGVSPTAVLEISTRVRGAVAASELVSWPRQRIVVDVTPAKPAKQGTTLDLAVALAIFAESGELEGVDTSHLLPIGELSLSGKVRPIRGAVLAGKMAKALGLVVVCSREDAEMAGLHGAPVLAVGSLDEAILALRESRPGQVYFHRPSGEVDTRTDFSELRGLSKEVESILYAVVNGFDIQLVGAEGSGKTALARRITTILPPLTAEDVQDVTGIFEAVGINEKRVVTHRPFRAPHHTVSQAGMIGDRKLRPGEATLAHMGVLYLDEAKEFPRAVLETLQEPRTKGHVRISTVDYDHEMPAGFLLVTGQNHCPCGRRGGPRNCFCTPEQSEFYAQMKSDFFKGMHRVDIHSLTPDELLNGQPCPSSESLRAIVTRAWEMMANNPGGKRPAQLDDVEIVSVWDTLFPMQKCPDDTEEAREIIARRYVTLARSEVLHKAGACTEGPTTPLTIELDAVTTKAHAAWLECARNDENTDLGYAEIRRQTFILAAGECVAKALETP